MIIKLEWFNCTALPAREAGLHQMLHEMPGCRQVSETRIRIEETPHNRERFHLVGMLRMRGPDVIAQGDGETFDDAMLMLGASIRTGLRNLPARERKTLTQTTNRHSSVAL